MNADDLIALLGLRAHPEGGHYTEVFRSPRLVTGSEHGPTRSAVTARPLAGPHGYALAGCTVAPGFDFADFEMPTRAELLALMPQHAELVHASTHA